VHDMQYSGAMHIEHHVVDQHYLTDKASVVTQCDSEWAYVCTTGWRPRFF